MSGLLPLLGLFDCTFGKLGAVTALLGGPMNPYHGVLLAASISYMQVAVHRLGRLRDFN